MSRFSKKLLLSGFVGMAVGVYADLPSSIIGGETFGDGAYAAFVAPSGGTPPPFPALPESGQINSVAINLSGVSLIGGQDGSNAYAALVSAGGTVSPLLLTVEGQIFSVAINGGGEGLIGGYAGDSLFAAQVSSEGIVTPLAFPTSSFFEFNIIYSVALNDDGVGLVGGEGIGVPLAAYVAPDGTLTPITVPDMEIGGIEGVALNDLGNGILGGEYDGFGYAAFVYNGNPTPSTLSLPTDLNYIESVAINHSGEGLIGGADRASNIYAAFVSAEGDIAPLFEVPFEGYIGSVALNDAGIGLIGGQNGSDLYAALVKENGDLISLITASIAGQINSVAIDQAGAGLIGGETGGGAYAALVAPNGTLTVLDVSLESTINSVALNGLLNATTPTSVGPYLGVIYMQLAAASALEARFTLQNPLWNQAQTREVAQLESIHSEMHLVSKGMSPSLGSDPKQKEQIKAAKKNSFWLTPFGDYVHLKAQGSIPNYTNTVGGALAGYDYHTNHFLVGATLGYAFNYLHYSESLGHGKIQEEMANVYGSYFTDHFRLNAVFWGGIYQFSNTRHTLSMLSSFGKTHGWIFSPHLEIASPWALSLSKHYFIEPFFMLDWVNSWQNHYTETGDSGFDLKMDSLYGSLLQSEVGLRFYESFKYRWGKFLLEEKVSYVNQAPFHFHSATTAFVGSASSFPIAIASTKVENLGALAVWGTFVPKNDSYPYGGFALQATVNGSYQSYFVSLFGGIDY